MSKRANVEYVPVSSHAHHLEKMAHRKGFTNKAFRISAGMCDFTELRQRVEVYHTIARDLEMQTEDTLRFRTNIDELTKVAQSSLPIIEHLTKVDIAPAINTNYWCLSASYRYLEDQLKSTFHSLERTYNLLANYLRRLNVPERKHRNKAIATLDVCPMIQHAEHLSQVRVTLRLIDAIAQPVTNWFCWLHDVTKQLLRQLVPRSVYIDINDPLLENKFFQRVRLLC